MAADEPDQLEELGGATGTGRVGGPVPYVVSLEGFDPFEVMFNAGRGVQTLIADEEGFIAAAVVPVRAWYPGARVPAGVPVMRPGQWLADGIDAGIRRRAAPDEAPGAEL